MQTKLNNLLAAILQNNLGNRLTPELASGMVAVFNQEAGKIIAADEIEKTAEIVPPPA